MPFPSYPFTLLALFNPSEGLSSYRWTNGLIGLNGSTSEGLVDDNSFSEPKAGELVGLASGVVAVS